MATENNSTQIIKNKNDEDDKKIIDEQDSDSVTESKTDDKADLNEIVEHILSENPSTSKTCSVPNCKQISSAVMNLTCQYCNMKYCMKHRYPEAHSQKCVEKARNAAHSNFKQESIHVITQERRNPGSTNAKNFSANKSREELKKRYKEKLDKARRNERGG
ncbi:DNA-binding protein SMUBP-2 [Rhizophagus clarus]|uniref:DNA-binding protein SMUBP-2 n=1 Tax=Rhizophagus clarus TaxID=94130 RepID=A0A8H3R322_9GLOM|nr:DNA-binding protein SMUBP-2 [Rhizophagus clarus]